jgi:protease-4
VPAQVKLFSDATDPLKEFTIQGTEKGKVLVISVRGVISTRPQEKFLRSMPSMVQEVVSQLKMAEKDKEIKCLLLKIDSPGGTVTASDILYNEITAYKERTHAKIVVSMMDVAASGGYYISLPADVIVAHPTTITGSIGVVFMSPNITGLMDKIGLTMEVNKSGKNKDMGSPFRRPTPEEQELLQEVTDSLADRFLNLVRKHREIDQGNISRISSARVFLAEEARELGLIDRIGYLDEAVREAQHISGLSENAKVVAYRRSEFPNDNLYNPSTAQSPYNGPPVIDVGIPDYVSQLAAGFYYIWTPALGM